MLQIEEAVALLQSRIAPLKETERISLTEALGRITAVDYTAQYDQPPFPRSPLDGYAVQGEDSLGASKESPMTLKVVGKIYAGEMFFGTIRKGEALRIMTGAPIPQGANTVIRQEDTDLGEDVVKLYASSAPWQNYCPQGEDYHAGDVLIPAHTKINGSVVAVLASLGYGAVEVMRQPKVAVFSTGDEVIQPGEALRPGKIYDSNRFYVSSRLTELGTPPFLSQHCPDDAVVVAEAIRQAAKTCDLIITTGGVSVGEKDILHKVLRLLGAEQLFWKVALKPGSPTLAAVYHRVPIVCLPGNHSCNLYQ